MENLTFETIEQIVLFLAILTALIFFAFAVGRKVQLVKKGAPDNRFDNPMGRLKLFLTHVVGQEQVIAGRPLMGLAHALVFWGFIIFLIGNLNHFAAGFGGSVLREGALATTVTIFLRIFAVLVLTGLTLLAIRRYIIKPAYLTYPSVESGVIISLITILMVTYLLFPLLGGPSAKVNWWIHTAAVLFFLVFIPSSKHLHLLVAPFNVFFKSWRLGELRKLDLEDLDKEDFGVNSLADFTWRDLLDPYACILCGRCTEACPANVSGKELNPREIIQGIKTGLVADDFEAEIADNMIPRKVLWQCTTCGACENLCPTGDEHLRKIIGLRRYRVAESDFPAEAANMFRGMEKNYNPWNYGAHQRQELISTLEIPVFEPGADYLFFMGCFAGYDQGYRPAVESLVKLLRVAGVSYGVLETELCCGDPVRRLGNEMIYQLVGSENADAIKAAAPPKIITACPHCMWTLRHDYRDFGLEVEVLHHTQLLTALVADGRLKLSTSVDGDEEALVYHDPCYLGRYAGEFLGPRQLVRDAGYKLLEPEQTTTRSFCCGGGGGQAFLEESEGERINGLRAVELAEAQASTATACPYCRFMLGDAMADKGLAEKYKVIDVAEVLAGRLAE
ncbi:(Fe-S)-binding protein [candidate division KSB1 bacterium]